MANRAIITENGMEYLVSYKDGKEKTRFCLEVDPAKWVPVHPGDICPEYMLRFCRAKGLKESVVINKHAFRNTLIPLVTSMAGLLPTLFSGAIITERVYMVPGIGNVLTEAINKYDNGVIVGVALFYALLSVTSFILGDVLMSMMDPRISFTSKQR